MSTSLSYLDLLLEPVTQAMTPEMARTIVNLRAPAEVESHIDQLRRKANAGTLSAEEDAEYKEFVEAVDVISILQLKARRYLAEHAGDHGSEGT